MVQSSWLIEYNKHLVSVVRNMLNPNQNSLSTLSVNYISYFYSLFPLHLNSFNTLFVGVINPKLLKLTRSVTLFTGMICDISKFITSLKSVSSYLNFNPAHELLNLIKTFDGNSYVDVVKYHIQKLIGEIDNEDVKTKYDQIIGHVLSLAKPYNRSLQMAFLSFKNKIEGHKTSLEQSINQYIQKIRQDLTKHSCFVRELISKICDIESQIDKFSQIYSKIRQSSSYHSLKPIFNDPNLSGDITTINQIFITLVYYRNNLREFKMNINRIFEIIGNLEFYSQTVSNNQNLEYETSSSGSNIVDPVMYQLEIFKDHIHRFISNIESVEKLEEIGKHIKTMKSKLNEVKDQVDEGAENYINGLEDITIDHSDVQESINKIKNMNNLVIDRLKIAKHTIEFYPSLETELKKLKDVEFDTYDFTVYPKNSIEIKNKLTSFETAIKPKLCNVVKQIKEIKKQNEEVTKDGVTCDLIKQVEKDYTSDIQKIKKSIEDSLKEIEEIKDLVHLIQNKKNQSETSLSDIKCKVCGIKVLKDATKTLDDSREELDKFVKLQERTKSLIGTFKDYPKFKSLGQFSNPLQDSIGLSYALIGNIELSINYLKGITKVDYLINWIKKYYNPRFETIKGIIKKFNQNVKEIIGRLGTINSNLSRLRWLQCRTSAQYNMWRLKVYMTYLKIYITNIRENFNVICGVIDQIRKDISKIDRYKCVLESLENYIECYINCNNDNQGLKKSVVDYLKSINDKINEILIIKNMIINCSHTKYIRIIEGKLICVETSINELECAIEGVGTNLIRCSIQSLSNHLINIQTVYWNIDIIKIYDVNNNLINNDKH